MSSQESRASRGVRRRKAVIDLNEVPRDHEGTTSASVRADPTVAPTGGTVPSQPVPTMIDVDAIEDDVIESSASAFAEAKSKSAGARRRPLMVDVESGGTTRLPPNVSNKRRRIPPNQPVIDCEHVPVDVRESSPKPPPPPPEEPKFSCPICMCPFTEETSTKCGHIFCKGCIKTAISRQAKCPTCRKRVTVKELIRVFLPYFSPHHLFVFANLHTSFLCFSADLNPAMGSSGDVNWKLEDHPKLPKGKTIGLIVLDGWGESEPDQYNCIHKAPTPAMDSLKNGRPDTWRLIKAHGTAVGLPSEDDMGNSEVGHNALGAGRIYAQGAKLVDLALESGKIYEDEGFKYISESFEKGTVHLIGLLSDGGVHSRLDQVQLLLKGFAERGAKRIRVHILTDGRDVLDGSSVGFVETLESELAELRSKGVDAQVASGGGRMYVTMDRYENDWTVVKRGWDAQVLGEAPHKFKNALEAVKKLRAEPKANDQYLPPFVIVDDSGKAVGPIVDGDAVVTFNFRADRMVMLAKALENEDFDKFDRVRFPKIRYAGMLQYDGELKLPSHYLVSPPLIDRTSGEYLAHNGVRTFACSETVKFGHVTFFWNGNRSGYFNEKLEKYVEIPSDSGISFNEQPKMKALEIAEKARDAILSGNFDQVRVNLPNGDMVGHTGDLDATVVACEAADVAVRMILDAIEKVGGIYVVTADHGNAEDMVKRDKAGKPALDKEGKLQILTSHTLKPVPIAIGGPGLSAGVRFRQDLDTPGLANVAATVMNLHGFVAPGDYEPSLIEVVDK